MMSSGLAASAPSSTMTSDVSKNQRSTWLATGSFLVNTSLRALMVDAFILVMSTGIN
jgi:hypothetical protein